MAFKVPERWRVKHGVDHRFITDETYGNNGLFMIPVTKKKKYQVVASDGLDWEHVSVVIIDGKRSRTPTWEEMCRVKDWFWDPEDCVMQLHPPKSDYVNNHPNCLHLWRPSEVDIPRPPKHMVGF